jgi:glycosyltransferase involved in cell wall biosynthesis
MRFVLPGKLEGIGWYSYETARRLALNHPEHEFLFLFDRPFDPSLVRTLNDQGARVSGHVVSPPARHPFLWYLWFEWALPAALRRLRADAFFSPDGYCSLRSPVPTLMVVHDLAFEHYRHHVPPLVLRYYRHFSPRYARRAEALATVSEATRKDLVRLYDIDPARISVVYNGANALYSPLAPHAIAAARTQYAAGAPYFIYVGSVHPRKNLVRLLQAFDQFAEQEAAQESAEQSAHVAAPAFRQEAAQDMAPPSAHHLVVAGRMAWQTGPVRTVLASMKYRDRVHWVGHLDVDQLRLALGGATALLYPSLFEGFGIPILEAFYAEVPVLTSNCSSMPEVAGQGALLVDPTRVEAIADGMLRLAREPDLRASLIAQGRLERLRFSWDKTAELTGQALKNILR